jgi:NAD(P)H-binding
MGTRGAHTPVPGRRQLAAGKNPVATIRTRRRRVMANNDDRLVPDHRPTGNTGSPATQILLERGHRVRALVHRGDDRSRRLADAGAEVAVGDLLSFDDVSSVMRGVSGAYFCYPITPGFLDSVVRFAHATTEAGIRSTRPHVANARPPESRQQRIAPALARREPVRPHSDAHRPPAADVVRRIDQLVAGP